MFVGPANDASLYVRSWLLGITWYNWTI